MISWIQNHLIRHGRWIFIILLAVVIVAFVFTIGNTPGITTDKSNYKEQVLFGIDVNNPNTINKIAGDVGLSLLLQTGTESRNERQIQNAISDRIVQLYLIDQLKLPKPTTSQLSKYLETLPYFQNESGAFDTQKYNTFLEQLAFNPSASEAKFLSVLAEDFQIDQLNQAIEGAGYATDAQVKLSLDSRNTEYDLFNIKINYDDYDPEIEVTEAILKDYYRQQKASYETEETVDASYVLFKFNPNIIAKFNDEQIEAYYAENKESVDATYRTTLDADSEVNTEDIALDAVQEIINAALLEELQAKAAENAANNFTYVLYDQAVTYGSEVFEATKKKYVVNEIEIGAYSKSQINQKGLSRELLMSAFNLDSDKYYSDPVETTEGFAVLFYKGQTPSSIPPFYSVADQLTNDYREAEKRKRFNEYGKEIKSEIEAIIESGDDFESSIANLADVTVEAYPNFSYNNRPENVNPYELQAVFRLNEGDVSDMINYGGTAIITYLRSKAVVDYEADPEESNQLMDNFKRFSRNTGLNGFYSELMSIELAKDSPDLGEASSE